MPKAKDIAFLYTTFASAAEAKKVSRKLLQEGFIACANILPAAVSLFSWQGKHQQAKEVPTLYKTTSRLAAKSMKRLAELHSYECPCIVEIPVGRSHAAYAKWIQASVQK